MSMFLWQKVEVYYLKKMKYKYNTIFKKNFRIRDKNMYNDMVMRNELHKYITFSIEELCSKKGQL